MRCKRRNAQGILTNLHITADISVIKDKSQNEKVDIMFKAEDVSNRIYEQMSYAIPKQQSQANRKKHSPAIRKDQNGGRKKKAR